MYDNVKIIKDINGIKYWAAWYTWRVPKYIIYRVFAYDTKKRWFFFKAIKSGYVISVTEKELYTREFKPFCIDTKMTTFLPLTETP